MKPSRPDNSITEQLVVDHRVHLLSWYPGSGVTSKVKLNPSHIL